MRLLSWFTLVCLTAACSRKGSDGIVANGTIELTQSDVASQVGGRPTLRLLDLGNSLSRGKHTLTELGLGEPSAHPACAKVRTEPV